MVREAEQSGQIAFLLGKPLHATSMLAEIVERLHHTCPTIVLHRLDRGSAIPDWLQGSTLVVQRGLSPSALEAAMPIEESGVRCCNSIAATQACHNRASVISTLSKCGVHVPDSKVINTWSEVVTVVDRRPIVVKTVDGGAGRGINVLIAADGILPEHPPFAGPYLAQAYVEHESRVSKLYVAGDRVQGLMKRAHVTPGITEAGIPFDVDRELHQLARHVGRASGLDIFGMDVLHSNAGPCVVDLNPFPGFRGVAEPSRLIADYLQELNASSA